MTSKKTAPRPVATTRTPAVAVVERPAAKATQRHGFKINAEYSKTWPNITIKREPPPDHKEWEGKPDKFQYFSPNPGEGD